MLKLNSELRAQAREALRGGKCTYGSRCCTYLFSNCRWIICYSCDWRIMFIVCWTSGCIRLYYCNAWRM